MEPAALSSRSTDTVQDPVLVFHADLVILSAIALFILLNAPRAFARLSQVREWTQGLILRAGPEPLQSGITNFATSSESTLAESGSSVTVHSTSSSGGGHSNDTNAMNSTALPRHISSWSSILHPLSTILSRRIYEGYSIVQGMLMLGYLGVIFYAAFYMSSPFTDPKRAAYVVMSQIPFVYAFAAKNGILGFAMSLGYEKLNYLHRFVGRLMAVGANVHALGYIYKWTLEGEFTQKIQQAYVRWGLVSLLCMDLLGMFSIALVRSTSYNLFFGAHIVGFLVFLPAICFHESVVIPYVIAASAIYGLDHVLRLIKSRFAQATLRPIPELGLTRVEVPSLNAGWHPGQHVRLRVFSLNMGWWGWTECHPFTIANVSSTPEGLVLLCKKAGRWTDKLYLMAQTSVDEENSKGRGRKAMVLIEGPYGGLGNTVMTSYSGAVFVAGGSGITFALSAVQHLVKSTDNSQVKSIQIIWSIQDPAALAPMMPTFISMIKQSIFSRLRISVFYTRATKMVDKPPFADGISLSPGRPDVAKMIDDMIMEMLSGSGRAQKLCGLFVGVCGPATLANSVARSVNRVDSVKRKAVGGVELHEEVFGW